MGTLKTSCGAELPTRCRAGLALAAVWVWVCCVSFVRVSHRRSRPILTHKQSHECLPSEDEMPRVLTMVVWAVEHIVHGRKSCCGQKSSIASTSAAARGCSYRTAIPSTRCGAKKMPVSVSSMRRRTTSRVRSGSNMRLIAPSEAFTRLGEGEESCASGDRSDVSAVHGHGGARV